MKKRKPFRKRSTVIPYGIDKIEHYAQQMRYSPTPAEGKLLNALLAIFSPYLTQPLHQFIIGPFIADFKVKNLIIEVDGSTHKGREAYDTRRSTYIENRGYRVLRLTNQYVHANAKREAAHIFKLTEPHQLKSDAPITITYCPPGSAVHNRPDSIRSPIISWKYLKH